MPAHEFIIRYREYSKAPGTWDEALFSLGEWPYPDNLPDERMENHPETTPKWLSVHFWQSYDAGQSYDEVRAQAKDHARAALRRQYSDARIY